MTFDMLSDLIELALINPGQSDVIPEDAEKSEDELTQWVASIAAQKNSADKLAKIRYRLQLLSAAQKDAGKAEELLSASTSPDNNAFPVLDFTRWPNVYYAVSGELQTPESEAYFQNISSAALLLRRAIADAERAKGTPALRIFEKILALNAALPERYKAMANILY